MTEQPAYWAFVERARARLVDGQVGPAEPEATRLLLALNRASGTVTYDLEATVHRPRGRSWAAYRLMFVLWLSGELESKEAARLTGQSRAATSNLTGPLVAAGVVAKRPDPGDGRGVLLSLTGNGLVEIKEVYAEQNARERQWAGALDAAERATLIALLDKLVSRPGFAVNERD
ncbi:MarR family winged helix-turn-helix transcriptional regulator [Mariniluteicoccus flavus]